MRKSLLTAIAALFVAVGTSVAAGFEIGVGANYWYSIKEAKDKDFDRDGLGWMVSSRVPLGDFFAIGLEVEQSPDNYAGMEERLYLPAAYAILGNTIYAGIGVGTYYSDGEFYSDTWYALRAGLKIPLITDAIMLDINVNYRVEDWEGIKEVKDNADSDTLMVGAALRLAF